MKALRKLIIGAVAMLWLTPTVWAESVKIQAQYRPDLADFMDVNPPGPLCVKYGSLCQYTKGFAVDLPIEFDKVVTGWVADPRDQYYIKVPDPTRVTLRHDRTGERQEVTLSFQVLQPRVYSPDPKRHPVNGLVNGCRYMWPPQGQETVVAEWDVRNYTACYVSGGVTPGTQVDTHTDHLSAIVRVDTPVPHRMKHGMWRGSVAFSVGNGGQVDLGNRATVTRGSTLEIEFELEVIHSFVLDFPPGSERAVLEPPGGWKNYVRGREPKHLYVEHPFRLWSSGPFKVYVDCGRTEGTLCGMRDRHGTHQVPFSVAITLPPAHTFAGAAVRAKVLPVGQSQALQIDSEGASFDRRGALRYEVAGEHIPKMLDNAGAVYEGLVTVIFDAEL